MTFAKSHPLAVALMAGTIAIVIGNTSLPAAATDPSAPASESDMTYFYKDPSPGRIAKLIVYFNGLNRPDKPSTQPPTIGFLAAAFKRYPADIDTMIPDGLSTTMQAVVATSLRLAGQDAKAQAISDRLKATGASVPDPRYVPASLDAVEAQGPNIDGYAEDMVEVARPRCN